jgi:TetR/AcrR family tetracycline transcriptional repressor
VTSTKVTKGNAAQVRLSRDLLIEACIRLADREGPEAVTLRRLGAELGVDATAVYRHFRSKDELLAAMADRLLSDALGSVEFTGKKEDLRTIGLSMRRAYLAHPRIALLFLQATSPMSSEARLSETTLAIIRGLGFSVREAISVFEVLESYTLAVSCMDGIGDSIPQDAWRTAYAALPPSEFPNLTAAAASLYGDPDGRFAFGLDLLLEAIEARATIAGQANGSAPADADAAGRRPR